uniref:Guanine nucleotide-binding protein subunit alpha-12 isoform X3 n=1 Tax=Tursiops truncatus TaxID=9739 RepID=A0A6J3Q1L5_TURTR|nr:guanine nucleotide-binding protein subunit alpha-12 isoform X3 [Tursiops truncatus]
MDVPGNQRLSAARGTARNSENKSPFVAQRLKEGKRRSRSALAGQRHPGSVLPRPTLSCLVPVAAAVFKKCPPSATGEARGGSGLSLPTSECFFGTLVTVGSQRPQLQTDSTKNLVTTPLSSLPQSEPGSSLFVTCVCAYIIPVVNLLQKKNSDRHRGLLPFLHHALCGVGPSTLSAEPGSSSSPHQLPLDPCAVSSTAWNRECGSEELHPRCVIFRMGSSLPSFWGWNLPHKEASGVLAWGGDPPDSVFVVCTVFLRRPPPNCLSYMHEMWELLLFVPLSRWEVAATTHHSAGALLSGREASLPRTPKQQPGAFDNENGQSVRKT